MIAYLALCLLALLASFPLGGQTVAASRHALVLSVDGLRPDLLDGGNSPHIRGLMRRGAYTMRAKTIAEGYTLPSHVSMLTGVTPTRHGVTWNTHIEESYPESPTLFELAKSRGFTTAMAAAKTKFIVFEKPGVLDWSYRADESQEDDMDVARQAVAILRDHQPDLMFVHFGGVDAAGHASGWGSAEQAETLRIADQGVGMVLETLAAIGRSGSTLVILTADHGGNGLAHPPEDPLSQFVPWIAAGPSVRVHCDLDKVSGLSISTMATTATVCWFLDIDVPLTLDAQPVREILD